MCVFWVHTKERANYVNCSFFSSFCKEFVHFYVDIGHLNTDFLGSMDVNISSQKINTKKNISKGNLFTLLTRLKISQFITFNREEKEYQHNPNNRYRWLHPKKRWRSLFAGGLCLRKKKCVSSKQTATHWS